MSEQEFTIGSSGDIELLVARDGTRPWHTDFFAIEQPENGGVGACIWVGDREIKNRILKQILELGEVDKDRVRIKQSSDFLMEYFRSSPKFSKNPVHLDSPCGDQWVGIAKYPLPPDHPTALSAWHNWTHFFHHAESDSLNDLLPPVEVVFDYLKRFISEFGYPQDFQHLTQDLWQQWSREYSLAEHFKGIELYFPWIATQTDVVGEKRQLKVFKRKIKQTRPLLSQPDVEI